MSPDRLLVKPVYGRSVKTALDYVLVVLCALILVAALMLVAIVVFRGSPL